MDDERPGLADVIRALGFEADDIEALGDYGGWKSVRCPFHTPDRNASASANVVLGAFICHACGIKGDAWSLIMHFKRIPKEEFRRAVEWATNNVGYTSTRIRQPARGTYKSPWAIELFGRPRN